MIIKVPWSVQTHCNFQIDSISLDKTPIAAVGGIAQLVKHNPSPPPRPQIAAVQLRAALGFAAPGQVLHSTNLTVGSRQWAEKVLLSLSYLPLLSLHF